MRSLELTEAFGLDNLHVVERPDPVPGPGEVLVRMRAASLNYRDLRMVEHGVSLRGGALPVVPLSDGCGVVESVGPGVTDIAVGERVASMFFQGWDSGEPDKEKYATALGMPLPGVGRELAVLSSHGVSRVPDFLTDQEVATLPCAALTAWRAVVEAGRVKPGGVVLLLGTGGVSIFALQFAAGAGCKVIITSSSDDKLERCRTLGAHETINYRTHPEWWREVQRLTDGRGADVVVEVGGAGTIEQSLKSVRIGGRIMVIGGVSGAGAGLNAGQLIAAGADLIGINVGSREMFRDMCRDIEFKQLRPVISQAYPWTEAASALRAMAMGQHFGKIVLDFPS